MRGVRNAVCKDIISSPRLSLPMKRYSPTPFPLTILFLRAPSQSARLSLSLTRLLLSSLRFRLPFTDLCLVFSRFTCLCHRSFTAFFSRGTITVQMFSFRCLAFFFTSFLSPIRGLITVYFWFPLRRNTLFTCTLFW